MDKFSQEKRRSIMGSIKSKNTTPELIVRRLLHKLGYRFRLHKKDLPGSPDIVLPKHKKVIFVNGCFWHGHENCKKSQLPETNREFWQDKISKNIKRDAENIAKLTELEWGVLIIWDCQTKKKDLENLEKILDNFIRSNNQSC
ncbi:very short patch repair endonuclease [Paenibacillus rigui]|uniref:Very short patch repair endonuclease n=1 Tax=Paenibacillus rigui TaxID=554312 RepID=A0A229USZ1_9BACL|nr:very short patch repair endonuclease [Paenibacillus rigui]OXM86265.1 very short patch repair endonuclease [Paenibacillus rigui]